MGWTSTDARFYTADGKVNRKAECDALYTWEGEKTKNEVIKSSMRGSVYYAAVRTTDKTTGHSEVFAAVCLTSTRRDGGFNFGYKGMAEDMGPCEDDCPKGILVLLTDTESKYAKEWRERCWAKIRDKKQNRQSLASIKIGEIIEFERGGVTIRAEKMAPAYQFKTPWFKVVGEFEYVHKTEIKDWRIVADNAATPSETPRISTEASEVTNVSTEGGNAENEPQKPISEIMEENNLHGVGYEQTDERRYYDWLYYADLLNYRTIADKALAEALTWIYVAAYRKGKGHIIAMNKDGVLIETVIAAAQATETPQISTETAETVNVSAEGDKEAERANKEQNHSDTRIVEDEYRHKYKVTRHWLNGRVESIEVWDLDHTSEPPQSPENRPTAADVVQMVKTELAKNKAMRTAWHLEFPDGTECDVRHKCTAAGCDFYEYTEVREGEETFKDYKATERDITLYICPLLDLDAPQSPETPQTVNYTTDTAKLAQTA